jgi:hypothetical protein
LGGHVAGVGVLLGVSAQGSRKGPFHSMAYVEFRVLPGSQ